MEDKSISKRQLIQVALLTLQIPTIFVLFLSTGKLPISSFISLIIFSYIVGDDFSQKPSINFHFNILSIFVPSDIINILLSFVFIRVGILIWLEQ